LEERRKNEHLKLGWIVHKALRCNRRERNAGLSATGAWIRIAVGDGEKAMPN
jgi:hypothetical protein